MLIYLAGPLGFSEAGTHFQNTVLLPKLASCGEIFNPWQYGEKIVELSKLPPGPDRHQKWQELNRAIGANNRRALESCDVVVAVLDGADVDSGTSAEIGYAFARGKRIVGYRSDFRQAGENEASIINPQVEYFIYASGGEIVGTVDGALDVLHRLTRAPAGS